jgi:hypothetical protein
MSAVPVKASDVVRRLTGIWRFGLPPAMREGTPLPYPAFLALLDCWINEKTGAAPSGGAGTSAKSSEQRLRNATQTSEQDRPKGIPPPKMTIAGEGPDRGHWWSEDQVRALVGELVAR